jgi:predicted nucleic acid-binding Zn finger protein
MVEKMDPRRAATILASLQQKAAQSDQYGEIPPPRPLEEGESVMRYAVGGKTSVFIVQGRNPAYITKNEKG